MAEAITIARPYAVGVFALAKERGDFDHWSEMLETAATVASDPAMKTLIGTPLVDRERLADLFIEICGERLDEQGQNLVRLLIHHRRLDLLPTIAAHYKALRNEAEGVVEVRITTARPLDDTLRTKLVDGLGRRLGRTIEVTSEDTDEQLLGGAIVRAGDLVIDGSARGQLKRMTSALRR